ncbi:MAG: glycerol-3-phosphate dehydrogenase, partial [Clostridia bacterium]|nr:glycerol-3-phosphate dehydrogenase [Clostridia bacterium]
MKITILGSGGWGLANTVLLNKNGHDITLWCFLESEAELLKAEGGNEKLLPGVKL